MSEFINNNNARIESLLQLCRNLIQGALNTELIQQHQDAIDHLTPNDIVQVVHRLVEDNIPMKDLKSGINKFLNICFKTIRSQAKIEVKPNHFLGVLMAENRELEKRLAAMKPIAKSINLIKEESDLRKELRILKSKIEDLGAFEKHYSRKENIFFPYFEREFPEFKCLGVMWSIHDDIRKTQKILLDSLEAKKVDVKEINHMLGDLFFSMYAIIFREEYLLFPVAINAVSAELWEEMNHQSDELGYSYIPKPVYSAKNASNRKKAFSFEGDNLDPQQLGDTLLNFDTGLMTLDQAMILLNHLPVDITMIDENDRVRFFSKPKDRFFTRSKAIIGRSVQNCHPPESVHVVEDLLKAFRNCEKDSESFWIQMKGRFILIQYFALRDEAGAYKGCIEVSQDVTEIRELKGEKRLMD
ncbi:DUF438 domain-containing protein [Ancylomarina longa]|uniref:DUF438 domain-containing protein n=1 Tax=Ancylomarina longa TaxID=2487017 RepID=A0A434B0C7_9BACT|nr:PAS domain-containing protein [Ancylomarina longa]RUT80167.1 DUF438 domain-containing protein [Ancylomarina longa]